MSHLYVVLRASRGAGPANTELTQTNGSCQHPTSSSQDYSAATASTNPESTNPESTAASPYSTLALTTQRHQPAAASRNLRVTVCAPCAMTLSLWLRLLAPHLLLAPQLLRLLAPRLLRLLAPQLLRLLAPRLPKRDYLSSALFAWGYREKVERERQKD